MNEGYVKQNVVRGFMIASLLLGIVFFVTNHLDFIIAAFENSKYNVPNVCYAILRLFSCIILPTIFIAPSLFPYSKIKITKICFWLISILYLLTTTWLFYFFHSGYVFENLFSSIAVTFFQQNITNAFVSAQVFWDTYEMIAVLFTIILSVLYALHAITFDDNRKIARILSIVIILFRIVTPILYNLIVNHSFCSAFWITNNFVEFLSCIAFTVAIVVASTDDDTWATSIWDEDSAIGKDLNNKSHRR